MTPIIFVALQFAWVSWIFVLRIRRDPSAAYRTAWAVAIAVIAGFDAWYLARYAYPVGFRL
jgi:hypothetical protein